MCIRDRDLPTQLNDEYSYRQLPAALGHGNANVTNEALNTQIGNLIDNYAHTEIGHFLCGIAHDVEIHI